MQQKKPHRFCDTATRPATGRAFLLWRIFRLKKCFRRQELGFIVGENGADVKTLSAAAGTKNKAPEGGRLREPCYENVEKSSQGWSFVSSGRNCSAACTLVNAPRKLEAGEAICRSQAVEVAGYCRQVYWCV